MGVLWMDLYKSCSMHALGERGWDDFEVDGGCVLEGSKHISIEGKLPNKHAEFSGGIVVVLDIKEVLGSYVIRTPAN